MKVLIRPSFLKGSVYVPASKSSMQRACALALLHHGKSIISNTGISNDDKAALGIITALGAQVSSNGNNVEIFSNGLKPVSNKIFCGESGLSFRMFSIITSLVEGEMEIHASGSLLQRPAGKLLEILRQLNVQILSNENDFPLKIKGALDPREITIDGSGSSQYVTGLLIALAYAAKKRLLLHVSNAASKPYIDLTVQMMKHWGYNVEHQNFEHYFIEPVSKNDKTVEYTVESDWSSASFLLVAAAINGDATLYGLDLQSTQADRAIMDVLKSAGAMVDSVSGNIHIKCGNLNEFQFDATDCPDLFPPLAVLAAKCKGVSSIKGVHRLAHKESNRSLAIQQEFGKLGIRVDIKDDIMLVEGVTTFSAAEVESHHDHRIAMATAILALNATGVTTINDAGAVDKSYPGFFADLQKLGGNVEIY